MKMQPENSVQNEINDQETELKGLLSRVMAVPLEPVLEKIEGLDLRLKEIEKQCNETLFDQIFVLGRNLTDQAKATKVTLEKFPAQFGDVVDERVQARLTQISQDIAGLNDRQMRSAELLMRSLEEGFKGTDEGMTVLQARLKEDSDRLVRELQLGVGRAESLAAVLTQFRNEHAVVSQAWMQSQKERGVWEKDQSMVLERYEQSIANLQARLTDLQSDAKAVVERTGEVLGKLVEGFSTTGLALELQKIQSVQLSARFANELRQSGERIDALAPQVSEKVDKFGGAVQTRLQQMQRRIVLLSVVSGLSLGGTVALLIKMLV